MSGELVPYRPGRLIPPPPPLVPQEAPQPRRRWAAGDVPHFALPFRFANPYAATTEQDSIDEIADCVFAILVCPRGFRVEAPEFGLADPVFSQAPLDLDAIREAVDTWEPRASIIVSDYPDLWDELLARIEVDVQVRTED